MLTTSCTCKLEVLQRFCGMRRVVSECVTNSLAGSNRIAAVLIPKQLYDNIYLFYENDPTKLWKKSIWNDIMKKYFSQKISENVDAWKKYSERWLPTHNKRASSLVVQNFENASLTVCLDFRSTNTLSCWLKLRQKCNGLGVVVLSSFVVICLKFLHFVSPNITVVIKTTTMHTILICIVRSFFLWRIYWNSR